MLRSYNLIVAFPALQSYLDNPPPTYFKRVTPEDLVPPPVAPPAGVPADKCMPTTACVRAALMLPRRSSRLTSHP